MYNDEEEDESAMGAVRYPCMPSLVSLQHMRNRLHLAYLGRKLMKWTALATGRELRRTAMAIDLAYKTFAEDIRHAYILLARGRYFCPVMNHMVLENVAKSASVTVGTHTKALTGVKVVHYNIIESDVEPYEHLGIENGGQPIHEAKIAWLELLKRLVLMLELRVSFVMIDVAHKSATKRKNVLTKTVLPRVMITISYILTELQEQEREERFRIKKIKMKKDERTKGVKKPKGKKAIKALSPICSSVCSSTNPSVTSHNTPLAADQNNKEDMKRLDHLLSHIDDIVKRLAKQEGVSSRSTKEFIDYCSKFRETLKSHTSVVPSDSEEDNTMHEGDSERQEENEEEENIEEFVKVIIHRNRDGTFTEEVQTTTIKTERKIPSLPNMPVKKDNVRLTKSDYHNRCHVTDEDNRRTLSATQSKVDVCPKKCASSQNKTRNSDTSCLACSTHGRTSFDSRKQGSTQAVWRDACTSSTDLDVIPRKPSKSVLKRSAKSRTDQSTCAIKIIAKPPPPPIVLPLRKKYDTDSTDGTSAHSKCLTCNYSSKIKGSDSFVCENCKGKSSKGSKSKRGVSDTSYCQKCQSAQEKAADGKVNKNNCPKCEKTKKVTPKHICPTCRTPSLNSSVSQLQGIVSLCAKMPKCLICGKEKTQEVRRDGNEPKCSILSFIKSKLMTEKAQDISCPCCGATDAEKTKSNTYRSRDPSMAKYTKSSNDISDVCCSLSNMSIGVDTDRCKSINSSKTESEYSDEIVGVCCSTQTGPTNSTLDDKEYYVRESGGCTGEAIEPPDCKSCVQMKDAAANTKTADRYDVRTLCMLPSRVSKTSKSRPEKVCNCQSMPIMNQKRKPLRRVTSFQL